MLKAARLGDQISHTQQRSGLIAGMILGALIVGAVLLAVASGGTAIPVLFAIGAVATGAAVGGGIGQLVGSEMTVPKGAINKAADTVFINGIKAARACVDTALCDDHTLKLIATGSTTVAIEGYPAARVSDVGACSFTISEGSANVLIGGATGACEGIEIEPEIEPWLENLHLAIGLIGSFCLGYGPLGWAGSALSTGLGFGGSLIGGRYGGMYFGKWGAVAGSILGGILGGGIGAGMSRGLGRAGFTGFKPQMRPASFSNFSKSVKEFEGNPALAKEAHDLYRQQRWGELENLMNKNGINDGYPPNNGAIATRTTTLRPGTQIDRYGGYYKDGVFKDSGKFASPNGASFGSRALPESSLSKPYNTYEVVKPIPNVQEGQATPWFGQPGKGVQYQFPQKGGIDELLNGGYLKKIP